MVKQSVFIVGATGNTGGSIANALLEQPGSFQVIAAIRPSSAEKPEVESLKSRGAAISIIDIGGSSPEQLADALAGVDVVICALKTDQLELQKPLIDAGVKAGVKRFVPDDWATACVRGARKMFDAKLAIHDYIKEAGIGYTSINVGWWYQLTLPVDKSAPAHYPEQVQFRGEIYGAGDVKTAVTDNRDIGPLVARIISDDRTLNRHVFCWAEEVTQNEIQALAERVSGKTLPVVHTSNEELIRRGTESTSPFVIHYTEYMVSLWVRGDNTVENAKREEYGGALDARELYPDLKLRSLEDFAKEYYASQTF